MNPLIPLAFPISFIVTYVLTQRWIRVAKRANIIGKDLNKVGTPPVAEMGGVPLVAGVLSGFLYYIALNTFVLHQMSYNALVLGGLTTALIIFIIGLLDDMLGWKIGLSQWQKPLLTIPAAIPLMVLDVGHTGVALPFVGYVDLGLLYSLVLVPIAIVVAANAFNMLAGYNGLECGMGIVMFSAITIVSYITGSTWVAVLGGVMVACLVSFIIFNWNPAKIFPGNAFTYIVGALVAVLVIYGNIEKLALVLFIPYYLDFLLPLRKRMKVEAFAKVNPDGSLDLPYDHIYDVTHISIKVIKRLRGKAHESGVVALILLAEVIIAFFGILLYV
jgi:UDP-N-acetylglucosamine--dolichyl-phosphate N-acetylglucosaminephosphotransferase